MVFALIDRLAGKYAILQMCSFYGVSRSGYYAWKRRDGSSPADAALANAIEECQAQHKRRYGYRRVTLWLRREKQLDVNHKRVLRVMRKYSLLSVIRRRRFHRYKANGNLVYANMLNRDFHADAPNKKWVTDISYIITPGGTLYLSAIRDLYDQSIVAYRMARRQDYSLVGQTIRAALNVEHPRDKIILHSDQGGQYRSLEYYHDTEQGCLIPSMSAPRSPGDNAMAENFFSILKTECIYLEKPGTPEEAERLTDEFIHYYMNERITHRGQTPAEVRRRWFEEHPVH